MIVNVADLVDSSDPQGRTFRQINSATAHAIPIGTLVEVDIEESEYHQVRAYVVRHDRDCDGTPMYSIGPKGYEATLSKHKKRGEYGTDEESRLEEFLHKLQQHSVWTGFCDHSLKVIQLPRQSDNTLDEVHDESED